MAKDTKDTKDTKGKAEHVKGELKEKAGQALGDREMERSGRLDKTKGRARQDEARAEEKAERARREQADAEARKREADRED